MRIYRQTRSPAAFILATLVIVSGWSCLAQANDPPEAADSVPQTSPDLSNSNFRDSNFRDSNFLDNDLLRAGYDQGFVIASREQVDLRAARFPFRIRLNGFGQLRHSVLDSRGPNPNVNQFQLKRGRLIFAGSAFTEDFEYFIQLDGRSSSGDDVRLLDFYLTYDLGHHNWGLERGTLGFKTGKYKMPFTMARQMSSKEFEFTDRSVSSTFFDVNRSLAWGMFGQIHGFSEPLNWEVAVFNGLVTGGAETGSSGALDDNFAYSSRIFATPIGSWGTGQLADFDWHDELAVRLGAGYATSSIDRAGTTEFDALRVVDSGDRLSALLPISVNRYDVSLYSLDASSKFRGLSMTFEYYFRVVDGFEGASVDSLYDHGFWFQMGKFIVPRKIQLLTRWSRVVGDSGTLGTANQSAEEIAGGLAWYFRDQHAKLVADITYLNGAPINSSSLDITPGEQGWLFRTQIQFSF